MNSNKNITALFELFIAGKANKEEFATLYELVQESNDDTLIKLMDDHYKKELISENANNVDWDKMIEKILEEKLQSPVHRVHFLKTAWFRWAAAIILFISGAYTVYILTSQPKNEIVHITPSPAKQDVLPGSDKAILTLADGQKIQLDNNSNSILNAKGITNNNALLSYSDKSESSAINTLTTPKGGQYKIRLSDGTMVWLNAASAITYPAIFTGKTRTVSVTGEAYFEVAKNATKPFIVKTNKESITVLGTSFNINAYDDEPYFKTSLITGSVLITSTNKSWKLQPVQAYFSEKIITTNIDQDIAWKNGVFNFNNRSLEQIMRQIANWYDVEIIYKGDIPATEFYGKIQRSLNLSEVLKILTGDGINFSIEEGKKLVVSKL